jgi:transcriptional regulator with XRE-family HTH domain
VKGIELKIDRIQKGIKLKQVAEALEYTNSYISMMECGKVNIPDYILHKWKQFLHIV